MALYKPQYEHWVGQRRPLAYRLMVITKQGLSSCLANRWIRYLVFICWALSLVQLAILFVLNQLSVGNQDIMSLLSHLDFQLQALATGILQWVQLNPDVAVGTSYNIIIYYFTTGWTMLFTLIAIGLSLPHTITRDLSSRAIVIYSSKALGRWDYILAKLAILFGLMSLTWLGPNLFVWLLSNVLAPDWNYFGYTLKALGHMLTFCLISMIFLSFVGLAISSFSKKENGVIGLWFLLWILGHVLSAIGETFSSVLQHVSFTGNLDRLAKTIFNFREDFILIMSKVPLPYKWKSRLDPQLIGTPESLLDEMPLFQTLPFESLMFMVILLVISFLWLHFRVKPQ